jgi:hypothetical protein
MELTVVQQLENRVTLQEFAFAPAAPETVRMGTGVGERSVWGERGSKRV